MAEQRRFGLLDFLLMMLVLLVAAGARAGYLYYAADGSASSGYLRVQEIAPTRPDMPDDEMERLIVAVRDGGLYGKAPYSNKEWEQTAHVSPGYPYLVGLLARAPFIESDKLFSIVRWIQVALGALTAVLFFLFARRSFRSLTVGLVAGLLVALNPFGIIATATIDDGILASFALAGAIYLGGAAGESGGAFSSLLFGLVAAGMALVRAAFLPLSFAAMIWFLVRSRSLERGWLAALVAFLGFVIGLAPWSVRNYQAIQDPVPIVTTGYLHLWIGNNEAATGGPATEEIWAKAPSNELGAIDNQNVRYARLGPRVLEEVKARPIATLHRRFHAFLAFYLGDSWLKDGTLVETTPYLPEERRLTTEERERQEEIVTTLQDKAPAVLNFWLFGMLFLALIGWRWSYAWRWESFPAALAAFWVPLPYILGHAEALSGPRLPLDGVLLTFAALTLVGLLPTSGPLLNPSDAGPPAPRSEEDA
jgi:hypothetical protein